MRAYSVASVIFATLLACGAQSAAVVAATGPQAGHGAVKPAPADHAKPAPEPVGKAAEKPAIVTPEKPAGKPGSHEAAFKAAPATEPLAKAGASHVTAKEEAATEAAEPGPAGEGEAGAKAGHRPAVRKVTIKEAEASAKEVVQRIEAVMEKAAEESVQRKRVVPDNHAAPGHVSPEPATGGHAAGAVSGDATGHPTSRGSSETKASGHTPGASGVHKPASLLKWGEGDATSGVRLSWEEGFGPASKTLGVRLSWPPASPDARPAPAAAVPPAVKAPKPR
jgi:hypothetical protein